MKTGIMMTMLTIMPLAGCALFPKAAPACYSLTFDAAAQANTTVEGQDAPIKVNVLMLRSDTEFLAADFFGLQRDPQSILSDKLLDRSQFFLITGQTDKILSGQLAPEVSYIGVFAEYQNYDGKIWRVSLPITEPSKSKLSSIWPFHDEGLKAHIVADVNGLRIVKRSS